MHRIPVIALIILMLAVPISGFAQSAIAVQIPTVRMPKETLPDVAPIVLDAAERIGGLLRPDRRL